MSAQWEPIEWQPEQIDACNGVDQISSAYGMEFFAGEICLDAELNPNNTEIQISLDRTGTSYLSVSRKRYLGDYLVTDPDVIVPGTQDDVYTLSFRVKSTSSFLNARGDEGNLSLVFFENNEPVYYYTESLQLPITADGVSTCKWMVRGGDELLIPNISLGGAEGFVLPQSFTFALEYNLEPVQGEIFPEFLATPADFDGDAYVINATSENTQLGVNSNSENNYSVGLEVNTPFAQDIKFVKEGGTLAIGSTFGLELQMATQDQQFHRLSYELSDVDICLGTDADIPSNGRMVLDDVRINYEFKYACFRATEGSTMVIPEGNSQVLSSDGFGMLLLLSESAIEVEEGAYLEIGGVLLSTATFDNPAIVSLAPGASMKVTENSIVHYSTNADFNNSIHVTTAPGATFDMTDAPPEVRALFLVNGVSASVAPQLLEEYRLVQNPVVDGTATIVPGSSAANLATISVIDMQGRFVAKYQFAGQQDQYQVSLGTKGVYYLTLTDQEGKSQQLKVLVP
ncbi:MAG: T9SS type A sorting domain-containing protein [Saprospiraceae bacterium]